MCIVWLTSPANKSLTAGNSGDTTLNSNSRPTGLQKQCMNDYDNPSTVPLITGVITDGPFSNLATSAINSKLLSCCSLRNYIKQLSDTI